MIVGDYNADPKDGDSTDEAILQLTENPFINNRRTPASGGGAEAAELQGGANESHENPPKFDTADFNDAAPGNLRVDYVLPSFHLRIRRSGVFWPVRSSSLRRLVGEGFPFVSSDHRLVFIDVPVKHRGDDDDDDD